jgi:Winged helix DNA-binding domain
LLAQRLSAQLLSGRPADSVVEVVERILAVQAQDPRGARLAVRARSTGLRAADVDRALTDDRSVVITTLNRGTLHLVRAEDYWWLHPLTTPQLAVGSERRLEQELVSPSEADRGVAIIERSLAADGPLTRSELRDRLVEADVRVEGQALFHIVFLATLRGLIVRGPIVGGDHAFVLVRDWLGDPPPPRDRGSALGELARRYLAGHGPASDRDLAKWAGITLGDARRGMAEIAGSLLPRDDGLASIQDRSANAALPPPRLLGSFDPSLHGWVSREPITGEHQGIVTTNGIFRPFAMVDGRSVATWSLTKDRLAITPLEPLSDVVLGALNADAARVVSYLGGA